MPKGQRWQGQFGQVGAAQVNRAGVVVALDPDPAAARLQAGDPKPLVLGQGPGGLQVVETVAQADHGVGLCAVQIGG